MGARSGILDRDEVLTLRKQGFSIGRIAKRLGIGSGTVVRTLDAAAEASRAFQNSATAFRNEVVGSSVEAH